MYNVSTALANALDSQKLYMRLTYGNTTLDADRVTNCSYSASCGGGDTVTIGGVTAAAITLTIKGRADLLNQIVEVEVGALVSGTMQYVPLGTFTVTDCQQGEDSTTVTGYDAAYCGMGIDYVPTVASGATVAAVLEDIAAQCNLTLATLPTATSTTAVTGDLTGHTCREMAGLVAALVGCNVLINRNGAISLRWFTNSGYVATTDDYYAGGLALSGSYTLGCITCTVTTKITTIDEDGTTAETEESQTLSVGGAGTGFSIENPYMTQPVLGAVWTNIGGLAYKTGSCSLIGGLLLEPGDLITVTDVSGTSHTIPIMSLALTIDGGCKAAISATGESIANSGANFTGGLTGAIQQIVADVAKIKNLSAENITAVKAKIDNLYADNAWVKNLFAQDITATGTISGLKLRGEQIDIESRVGTTGKFAIKNITYGDKTSTNALALFSKFDDDSKSYLLLESGRVVIGGQSISYNIPPYVIVYSYGPTNDPPHVNPVLNYGTVVVCAHLGWCQVFGSVIFSETYSEWTNILDPDNISAWGTIPAPIHKKSIFQTVSYWNAERYRPARIRISPSGGLHMRYGEQGGEYSFSITYPYDSTTNYIPNFEEGTIAYAGTAIVGTSTVS